MRRIGVLSPTDENDPRSNPNVAAFTQALAGLGLTDGRATFEWTLVGAALISIGYESARRSCSGCSPTSF
jgi:hypothetical protein